MPLILVYVVLAGLGTLVILAALKKLLGRRSPFGVDMGKYICTLRKDVLSDSSDEFDELLRKYLCQAIPEDERELARKLNALSCERVKELFVELMRLNYAN